MPCLLLLLATLATHAYAGSGERVHIRLHMPEIVRQHTHVHKVYKLIDAPPVHGVLPSKWPSAQPHISLLGYTTTASGTGPLMPDLTKLIATPTPTLTPNYGPALFDNKYLSESQPKRELQEEEKEAEAGKFLQQLFKPNIVDAMDTVEEPGQMEHNELLNNNFLAALQREYMAKFGSKPPKTKRQKPKSFFRLAKPIKPKTPTKSKTKTKYREQESEEYASNYLQDFEEQEEEVEKEEEELPIHTNYAEQIPPSSSNPFYEHDDDADYDSASAFSTLNNNGLSFLPTPDEFLNHIHGPNSYTGNTYADLYDDHDDADDYGPPPTGTAWKTVPSNGSSSSKLQLRHRQRRRPALDMTTDGMGWASPSAIGSTSSSPSTASGHSHSSSNNSHHMRFPKLINRRKRKNRIKSKIFRI